MYFKEGIFFITARLYDTAAFVRLNVKKYNSKKNIDFGFNDFENHFTDYDNHLDKTTGLKNYLKDADIAKILVECIHSLDGKEYVLIAYTIMPNHFHLVIKLLPGNTGLSRIMQLIKGRSAFLINKELNLSGKFWQDESYDRWVRDDKELYFIINYVLLNPVKAGFVDNWLDWQFTYCKKEYITL